MTASQAVRSMQADLAALRIILEDAREASQRPRKVWERPAPIDTRWCLQATNAINTAELNLAATTKLVELVDEMAHSGSAA